MGASDDLRDALALVALFVDAMAMGAASGCAKRVKANLRLLDSLVSDLSASGAREVDESAGGSDSMVGEAKKVACLLMSVRGAALDGREDAVCEGLAELAVLLPVNETAHGLLDFLSLVESPDKGPGSG
jgi:hypothetical protein